MPRSFSSWYLLHIQLSNKHFYLCLSFNLLQPIQPEDGWVLCPDDLDLSNVWRLGWAWRSMKWFDESIAVCRDRHGMKGSQWVYRHQIRLPKHFLWRLLHFCEQLESPRAAFFSRSHLHFAASLVPCCSGTTPLHKNIYIILTKKLYILFVQARYMNKNCRHSCCWYLYSWHMWFIFAKPCPIGLRCCMSLNSAWMWRTRC